MSNPQASPEALQQVPSDDVRTVTDMVLAHLDVLLSIDGSTEAFAQMFRTLQPVFAFDQAMVLEVTHDRVHCTAAVPAERLGESWDRAQLDGALGGRVVATGRERDMDVWRRFPADLVASGQPALCFPIGVLERQATLMLLRTEGAEQFSDGLVAVARQSAIVALAALAARQTGRYESEIHRLTARVEQLRQSERRAQQNRNLIKDIVDQFPISLSAQDEHGRYLLVNSAASAITAIRANGAPGTAPSTPETDAQSARQHYSRRSDGFDIEEERIADPSGERIWLTTRKTVCLDGRNMRLASSYDITRHKQIEAELTRRANFDELTELPNRILIQQYVQDLIARGSGASPFALSFIDLDNFKQINDYYSHAVGDALLVKVAQRIKTRLRDSDMLARISGDEFLLVLHPVANERQAHAIIQQLIADLKQPFHIEAFEMFTSASIGVSFFPHHGNSYEELRRNADNAMYQAKSGTKGDAVYFNATMGQKISDRMQHEQRLRLAIRDRRFCCAFQPKVDIHSQEVVGFETLVRWRDDDGELHAPGTFIDIATELGLIDPITHFVVNESLSSIKRLDESFGSHTSISVNIAARQANDLRFMRTLVETLGNSELAGRVMLELTEDAFVAEGEFQTKILPMLRDVGVRVSIDDFGTGYSSLSVLSEITADEIKIDRSFITGIHERPRSQSILKAIESLGHALGMTMVAEGVETFEELAYLHATTRIRYAQGYYFSKPFFLSDAPETRRITPDGRGYAASREHSEGRSWGSRAVRARS